LRLGTKIREGVGNTKGEEGLRENKGGVGHVKNATSYVEKRKSKESRGKRPQDIFYRGGKKKKSNAFRKGG